MRWRAFRVPPPASLAWWAARDATFTPGSARLRRRDSDEVAVEPADPDAAFARGRAALLAYRVYPESLLVHRVGTPDGRVAAGAVIVQRVRVGPLALEAGVRVLDAWDAPDRAGFSYVTLRGHPERGVASFALTRQGGRLVFRMESESEAAWPLLGPPGAAYARRRQRGAVAAGLTCMRAALGGPRQGT